MANQEYFKGYRVSQDAYSAWHRTDSIKRFVGEAKAKRLAMCDIDAAQYVEMLDGQHVPLVFVEAALDKGQTYKPATCVALTAQIANLPGFVMLYTLSKSRLPCDDRYPDITSVRAKRLWPNPENEWSYHEPAGWLERLVNARKWAVKSLVERGFMQPTTTVGKYTLVRQSTNDQAYRYN